MRPPALSGLGAAGRRRIPTPWLRPACRSGAWPCRARPALRAPARFAWSRGRRASCRHRLAEGVERFPLRAATHVRAAAGARNPHHVVFGNLTERRALDHDTAATGEVVLA